MGRMNPTTSQDWLDQLAAQVCEGYPEGELIVSSGHSPSGTYHIGTLREIMTANAITWALRRLGRKARHIDFVDDFDAFRKVPKFVPEEWEKYLGQPVSAVPDPWDCHESYGAHFMAQLHEGLAALGAMPDETVYGHDTYPKGVFTDEVVTVLDKLGEVRQILTEVGGRQLEENWAPVEIMDDQGNLRTRKFAGWDSARREVAWRGRDGETGTVAVGSGQVKLSWRLDWPARWAKWGVTVEPFGRDHATKGGSYDTGKVLVDKIFGGRAPYPVPYEFINTVGETKKMSKSTGNVLTPADALEVMPPEILRYFVIAPRPGRTLNFDSGLGLYTLIDEYLKALAGEKTGGLEYARTGVAEETISSVPFNHLVAVYQAARRDAAETRLILTRTGYDKEVAGEWPVIERELTFVGNWLEKYAPDSVKFAVQETQPRVELSDGQRAFLAKLAGIIEAEKDLNGQGMHDSVYAAAQVADLKPGQAFVALYRVILGQDSGPKAGWFLASLEREWLVQRLTEGSTSETAEATAGSAQAVFPDGRTFTIDAAILEAFPGAAVGYIVADVAVTDAGHDGWPQLAESLAKKGITRENLTAQPEIKAWREAYRSFGVKPSDFPCSVEALTKRVLAGKQIHVNSIVDTYNYVSVEYGLTMGAMDLDHLDGDFVLRYGRDGETARLFGVDVPVAVTDKQAVYVDGSRIFSWLWNYRDAPETSVTPATRRAVFIVDSLLGPDAVKPGLTALAEEIGKIADCKILGQGVVCRNK